jgi:hypothetical protein
MTDELRELLHAAVPEPPAAPDRASGARERHRRTRRRTTVAAVAGAVAVVVVAALPALVSDAEDRPQPDVVAPSPTPSAVRPGDFLCPDPRAVADRTTVPHGAIAVRLCEGKGIPVHVPADALVTQVDALADVVNRQPPKEPTPGCQLDLGPGYLLAFQYADGAVLPVSGELYGCQDLTVGTQVREHPEVPLDAFRRSLRAQRAAAALPVETLDAAATPSDVVTAYVRRLAVGDDAGADALWISLVPVPSEPPFDPRAPFEITDVKRLRFVSAWRDAVAVTVRHELPSPAYGEDTSYGEVVFTLGRDENGAFRIVHVRR